MLKSLPDLQEECHQKFTYRQVLPVSEPLKPQRKSKMPILAHFEESVGRLEIQKRRRCRDIDSRLTQIWSLVGQLDEDILPEA